MLGDDVASAPIINGAIRGGVVVVRMWRDLPPEPAWRLTGWLIAGLAVVLSVAWSYAFARPAIRAPLTARAGLTPASWVSWRRATLLSAVALGGILAVQAAAVSAGLELATVGDAGLMMIVAAAALDARDERRIRGGDRVAVWAVHQPQYAELVRRVLADAGIACELAGSHVRALLCVFGPYVPIDVHVAPASADDARRILGELFAVIAPAPEISARAWIAER